MTATDFGKLALSHPETEEHQHMGHPDFRVAGKIFATLGYPDKTRAMVKLSPEDQHNFSKDYPAAFVPVEGIWGRRGATSVYLKAASKNVVAIAIKSRVADHCAEASAKIKVKVRLFPTVSNIHATLRIPVQKVRSPLRKNPEVFR